MILVGEKFCRIDGTELVKVMVTCPACGIGMEIDLSKPLGKQLREGVCTCGEPIGEIKELVMAYKTALDIINTKQYKVGFSIKCE
ncbi:MAG: hypothetical protein H0Z35_09175 [Thermoanaerobacteraceae bacterium]|nr:hypothetical protein [Thermoanaerobacteraceae bacterium]